MIKKQPKTPVKVTGEVIPMFKGVPEDEITLLSEEKNVAFTNFFTFTGTTTNYTLSKPDNPAGNRGLSFSWTEDTNLSNTWHLTTVITQSCEKAHRTFLLKIPVNGSEKTKDINIRFKILTGQPLKVIPSKLIVSQPGKPLSKRFIIYTHSTDVTPADLNYQPKLEGLSIKTEVQAKRHSSKTRSSRSRNSKTKYICNVSATADALEKLLQMKEPKIVFEYPKHKQAILPVVTLTPPPKSSETQKIQ